LLLHDVEATLQELSGKLRSYGIRRIGIFGSTARGDQTAASDLDLLLEFKAGSKSFDSFMDVVELLELSFQVPLDVLTIDAFEGPRRARVQRAAIYYEIGA